MYALNHRFSQVSQKKCQRDVVHGGQVQGFADLLKWPPDKNTASNFGLREQRE